MLKKLRILGCDYRLTREADGERYIGVCFPVLHRIGIAKGMAPAAELSTILHEVIEAINDRLRLKLPHRTIVALEAALHAVLADNPKFLAMWGKR